MPGDQASYYKTSAKPVDGASGGGDPYEIALEQVRDRIKKENIEPELLLYGGERIREIIEGFASDVYKSFNSDAIHRDRPKIPFEQDEAVKRFLSDILGMGPWQPLFDDQEVEDIAQNGPNECYVFKRGKWEFKEVTFPTPKKLLEFINGKISHSPKVASEATPIIDATLRSGERVSVVTAPVSSPWPVVVIRIKRKKGITLGDFVTPRRSARVSENLMSLIPDYTKMEASDSPGMLTAAAATYIHAAVLAGMNIIVAGATGSGKTTFVDSLGALLPEGERIIAIENTPELTFHPNAARPMNTVYFCTRDAVPGGAEAVTEADLVRVALRQRPRMLTQGESRGAEILDLLNALNTGHKNGLTTIHANGVEELFNRIFVMLSYSEVGRNIDRERAAFLVGNGFHIVMHIEQHLDYRLFRSISEYTGRIVGTANSPTPELKPLFEYRDDRLVGPLSTSVHHDKFLDAGIDPKVFERFTVK